jgi:hypothetical protein
MDDDPVTNLPGLTETFRTSDIEIPVPSAGSDSMFVSDVLAETVRLLNIPYIALNPGASYRGLHDSLVKHLGVWSRDSVERIMVESFWLIKVTFPFMEEYTKRSRGIFDRIFGLMALHRMFALLESF